METFNLPKYSKVIYRLNPETKYFIQSEIQSQETPLKRLPDEMRLAPAGAANIRINAPQVLISRINEKGKYPFITGIQETLFKGWYLGNDYEFVGGAKVLSIILFRFIKDNSEIEVYYFYRYDKPNSIYRMQFANTIIPNLADSLTI